MHKRTAGETEGEVSGIIETEPQKVRPVFS